MAFFQSIITYGLRLWGAAPGVERVLLLQKKAIRIVAGAKRLDHCEPIFKAESLMTVYNLFIFQTLIKTKEELGALELRSDIHSYNTRSKQDLNVPFVRLKKLQSNYDIVSLKLFNVLSCSARNLPSNHFKRGVECLLLASPIESID